MKVDLTDSRMKTRRSLVHEDLTKRLVQLCVTHLQQSSISSALKRYTRMRLGFEGSRCWLKREPNNGTTVTPHMKTQPTTALPHTVATKHRPIAPLQGD